MAKSVNQDYFEIIDNGNGDLALFIPSKQGEPVDPCLLFDKKDTALFFRGNDLSIKLEKIVLGAAKALCNASKLLVTEIDETEEKIIRTYWINIRNVERLPL